MFITVKPTRANKSESRYRKQLLRLTDNVQNKRNSDVNTGLQTPPISNAGSNAFYAGRRSIITSSDSLYLGLLE